MGDITCIAAWEGWAYLAAVIDLGCRPVLGWALADHLRTDGLVGRRHQPVAGPVRPRA